MPDKGGPSATVLVVQEIFGVHEHIKDICRRFAKLGYYAIAPELYAREGNPAEISDIKELVAEIVSKVPDTQVMSDLDATVPMPNRPARQTRRSSRLPASAGAAGSPGSMPRTTRI